MKYPTTVKKYRITDYSQLTDVQLLEQLEYFMDKTEEVQKETYNHMTIKKAFSLFLNMENLTNELFIRNPKLMEEIDFQGALEKMLENNSINPIDN